MFEESIYNEIGANICPFICNTCGWWQGTSTWEFTKHLTQILNLWGIFTGINLNLQYLFNVSNLQIELKLQADYTTVSVKLVPSRVRLLN